jgi:hypothetical protein
VVFKNQARGTEEKGKRKEFINVSLLRVLQGCGWVSVMLMTLSRICCGRTFTSAS